MFFYLYMKGVWGTSVIAANSVGYVCGVVPIVHVEVVEVTSARTDDDYVLTSLGNHCSWSSMRESLGPYRLV